MANEPNLTTGCGSYPVTLLPECSGNGLCVFSEEYQRPVCECFSGFRGNADFQTVNSLVSCHINDTAIIVLWSVALVIMVTFSVLTLRNIRTVFLYHDQQNARLTAAGKSPQSILANKSFVALLPFIILGYPSLLAICILRIIDQRHQVIGKDWALSMLWLTSRGSFYFTGLRFQPELIESLLRGQRACEELLWKNTFFSYFVMFLSIAPTFLIFAPLTVRADPFDFFWGRLTYIMCSAPLGVSLVLAAFQARYALKKINEVLVASYESTKNAKTLSIANELKAMQRTIAFQQTVNSFVQLFIACAPFMWAQHDYVYPLTGTITMFVGFRALDAITRIQRRALRNTASAGVQASESLRKEEEGIIIVNENSSNDVQ